MHANMTQPAVGCREHEDSDAPTTSDMTQVSHMIYTGVEVRAAMLAAVGTCVVLAFGAMPGRRCFLRVTQVSHMIYTGVCFLSINPS